MNKSEDFKEIYEEFQRFSVEVAFQIVKDNAMAEDISQDTFVNLYKKRNFLNLSNKRLMKALIFSSTCNMAKDYLRKSYVKRETNFEEGQEERIEAEAYNTEDVILFLEKKDYLIEVLKKLKKKNLKNYSIYMKVKYQDISQEEVAKEYGMTTHNVANRIHRIKRWIDKEMEKLYMKK